MTQAQRCSQCAGKGYTEKEERVKVDCDFCQGKFILREGITFCGLFTKFCKKCHRGKIDKVMNVRKTCSNCHGKGTTPLVEPLRALPDIRTNVRICKLCGVPRGDCCSCGSCD